MPATVLSFPHSRQAVPTIAKLLDGFLDDITQRRGRSVNTIRSYRSDVRMLARELPQPIDTIALRDLELVLMSRNEQPATTNRRVAAAKHFFRWCRREGHIDRDPAEDLDTKTQPVALPRPIPAADLRVLDRAIKALDRDATERLIFTILRETGMRADEVLSLNVGDVTLESGREALRVVAPKNYARPHDRADR